MDTSKLMFRDGLMKDERILITGGGTGLGKEMAEGFLKLGAEVHICGRRIDQKRKGNVCSILTTWVWNGGPFVVPSAMSKAAVNTMTQSLAVEWGRYGLRFNAIAPGPFPTKGAWARLSPDSGESSMERGVANPMGRVGEMHELVNLAVLLMAPGCEYINGQTIAIDGAMYNASGGNFSALAAWSDEQWAAARDAIEGANAEDKAKRTV